MAKKRSIKLDIGTVYQKEDNGIYFFRYQVNGKRKAVSLKTKNQKDAITHAENLLPVVKATSTDVISAHVKQARELVTVKKLELQNVWDTYSKHPDRATPATVNEQLAYKATFEEFKNFFDDNLLLIGDITTEMVEKYAAHLRKQNIAVDTHNRKIKRLKRIFETLKEYRQNENPLAIKSLRRKEREEQDSGIPTRIAFTREEEEDILKALSNDKYKVKNKPEIRVIYYIGMFTGQRLKDCVFLRWDKVDLNRKRIWVKQFKTGKEVTIPIAQQLLNALKEAQEWKTDNYVCPNVAERYKKVNKQEKNIGSNLVNIDVLRVIKWIGLEPSVKVAGRKKKVTVYGFHSLRHSFASFCAEAGVPKAVVVSILGANSEIVDKHYTHIGEEAQEAALRAITGEAGHSDRERINQALELIDSLKSKPDIVKKIEQILR